MNARPRRKLGHNPGTSRAESPINSVGNGSPLAQGAIAPLMPRLLDLHAAAAYLGVSEWTVRDLEAAGVLQRVRVPLPNHGELRKLLFDRVNLDALIERWKDSTI